MNLVKKQVGDFFIADHYNPLSKRQPGNLQETREPPEVDQPTQHIRESWVILLILKSQLVRESPVHRPATWWSSQVSLFQFMNII